jgi:preprotein translocase subunit SecE
MGVAEKRELTMTESDADAGRAAALPAPRQAQPRSLLEIYKPGQGTIVRWSTAAGAGILAFWFVATLGSYLALFGLGEWLRVFIPVLVLVGLGIWIFRMVGQSVRIADFLIATEAEMKKVNWSTRREVLGATKIVIIVILAMGTLLFFVDVFFMGFFEWIGVLRIGMLKQIFSPGAGG